jgi:hypothetical protein
VLVLLVVLLLFGWWWWWWWWDSEFELFDVPIFSLIGLVLMLGLLLTVEVVCLGFLLKVSEFELDVATLLANVSTVIVVFASLICCGVEER